MRRVPAYALAIATGAVFTTANAQFTAVKPAPSKTAVTTATSGTSGGFFGGSDDCNSAHTNIGSGDIFGQPFTTGSTGTQGQNEANCYAFGSTAIDNDVWFDWTANMTGSCAVSTCAGTSVDTKIAAYPLSTCPADGTSLACNDDACGLQSTTSFPCTAGTSYTIQLGTFPGASGGVGAFNVTQGTPPPCGVYDDGTTENALGLTAGGETGWLHSLDCLMTVDSVDTAYGTSLGTAPPNGNASRLACYEDTDCDSNPTTPAGGMATLWSATTTVTNATTDIINMNPTGGVNAPSRCIFVMATADQVAGEFPAPMDQTNPTPNAWVVGNTPSAGSMDIANLNNNNVPPLQTDAIGFPTAWLLRTQGTESPDSPGVASCFGDGSGAACGCGNNGDGTGGCNNSLNTGGAILAVDGAASIGSDTLNLIATRTTNQPGIFFQGDNEIPMTGGGLTFGDGIRCCGNNVIRCGTWSPAGNTTDTASGNNIGGNTPPISDIGPNATMLMPGDTKCYQWWYRDPSGPCGGSFNLSNAQLVMWGA